MGLRKVHLVLDAVILVAAVITAYGMHAALRDFTPALKALPRLSEYAAVAYLGMPLWLALISIFNLNRSFERPSSRTELVVGLLKFHAVVAMGIVVVVFATESVINRSLVALILSSSFLLMLFQRFAIGAWVRFQHRRGYGRAQVLVVGDLGPRALRFLEDAERDELPPQVIGYLSSSQQESDLQHLGRIDELADVIHREAVDEVVFFAPYNHAEQAPEALGACEEAGVHASFAVDMVQLSQSKPRMSFLYEHPFISFDVAPKRPEALAVKHSFDVLSAAFGLLLVSPILVIAALGILVTMGRPIFFTQERAGLYGRRFRMIKFRTMVKDAEAQRESLSEQNEMSGPVFKITGDPRVTRLGSFLRKTSIDELPQLFNVLSGTMSLVGPRPLPVSEQQEITGWQSRRLSMRPGITGMWQVSGRSDIDFDEWMALDIRYIDEWSLALDLRLLFATLPVVLFGRGAR